MSYVLLWQCTLQVAGVIVALQVAGYRSRLQQQTRSGISEYERDNNMHKITYICIYICICIIAAEVEGGAA